MNNALEPLVGKLVKVVYRDGPSIKVRKGRLLGADDQLLMFRTLNHTYAVGRASVIEIKSLEGWER